MQEQFKIYHRKLEVEALLKQNFRSGNIKDIHHADFERLVEELFNFMDYSVYRVGGSADGGVDIQGKNKKSGEKIIIQCKRYKGKVGIGAIRDFFGTIIHTRASKGYFVTSGEFTKPAIRWSKNKPIKLIDGKELISLISKHYK